MPDWVREGINPSPTLDPLTSVFGYLHTKSPGPGREPTKDENPPPPPFF